MQQGARYVVKGCHTTEWLCAYNYEQDVANTAELTNRPLRYIHSNVMKWQHKQQTASSNHRHHLMNSSRQPDSMSRPQNNWHCMLTTDIVRLDANSSPSSQCCSQQLSCSLHLLLAAGLHLAALLCDHPTWYQPTHYKYAISRITFKW